MKFLRNLSISTKIVIFFIILSIVFLGSSFFYAIFNMKDALFDYSVDSFEKSVINKKEKIQNSLNEVKTTVLSLRTTPSLQGILRANSNNGFDFIDNSTAEEWVSRLELILSLEMESNNVYDQLRYIDLNGQEIVRVNLINGEPQKVENDDLQNKSDRGYFLDTINLRKDDLYVSKTELNKEGNPPVISIPYKPVIRFATPVFNEVDGEKRGVLVSNISVDNLISNNNLLEDDPNLIITDSDGFFINHKDELKEWGGPDSLKNKFSIFTEFPGLEKDFFSEENGSFVFNNNVFSYSRVKTDLNDPSKDWILINVNPNSIIVEPINRIVMNASVVVFFAFSILFLALFLIIKKLLSPLKELSNIAIEIGKGNFDVKFRNIKSKDEVGRVALAINSMVNKLNISYSSLEDQVKKKTLNLNEKVGELEKSQKAMINVLEDIESEKEKNETILQSIGDGVFVVDQNLNIVVFNSACSELTGFSSEEALGKNYKEVLNFVFENTEKINDSFIKKAIETGQMQEMEGNTQLIKKDGSRINVSDSAAPLKDSNNNIIGVVVVFRDTSKEREIDKAKTEFVSLASHQLRTPLSSINWYTEMLLAGDVGKLNKEQIDFMKEIYQGNQRMVDLVNSLLNVSRIELGTFAVDPSPTNFEEVAKSVIKELKPRIQEKKIKIEEKYDKSLPEISADPKLVRIIFQNFLSNAVKYTEEEDVIGVELSKEKDSILIKVSDSGYGIPEDQKSKIFTKMFRADNVREKDTEGTGLGLYIVKAIVKGSGGKIWFESKENEGTTFYVTLPLSGMKKRTGSKELK